MREPDPANFPKDGRRFTEEERKALVKKARPVFVERVAHYAPLMKLEPGRITVRTQKTRWGSCSQEGNLNFNALLLLAPPEALDMVVVHELCHLKYMNHSKYFYFMLKAEEERRGAYPHAAEGNAEKETPPALVPAGHGITNGRGKVL